MKTKKVTIFQRRFSDQLMKASIFTWDYKFFFKGNQLHGATGNLLDKTAQNCSLQMMSLVANMGRWPNVDLLLAHRLRRWPSS